MQPVAKAPSDDPKNEDHIGHSINISDTGMLNISWWLVDIWSLGNFELFTASILIPGSEKGANSCFYLIHKVDSGQQDTAKISNFY